MGRALPPVRSSTLAVNAVAVPQAVDEDESHNACFRATTSKWGGPAPLKGKIGASDDCVETRDPKMWKNSLRTARDLNL